MFNIDDCIGFITNKGAKKLADEFNKRVQEYGMTRVQWIALFYIGKSDGIFQKELSDLMNVKESSMVRLIDRMEKEDLVIRKKQANDRRVTSIFLTHKGKELREKVLPLGQEFQDDATKEISSEELDNFKKVLEKMIKNIC
ncbi:MarR family winged helix-turn-helix transcriptional regulator [Eubacterium multiforme]|uniref:DNA-binding MarR family transcriptional regulator n=1 Tax=Eubacterium multiforme TaxID=83339 RepID=A0ABT9URH0_9FIRM|nr:MarR family transcriptional regulator [Eubacterium multiforme]MDQ0148219.1 DNA-binding MarR family transcriptional regulator [Eubacterium multiforme]